MAARSNRTGELTTEDLVAMFGDERRTLHLECGQVLFKNGDTGGSMFVVRSGTLTIRSGSVVYEDVGPGGMVGEMGIVESNMPRSAMVYALTSAELVEVDEALSCLGRRNAQFRARGHASALAPAAPYG